MTGPGGPRVKTDAIIDELCDLYRKMKQGLSPTGEQGGTGEYHPHQKPGSRSPISLAVSDQVAAVDKAVDDIALQVRDMLGFEHRMPPDVEVTAVVWHERRFVCQLERVKLVDYSTVATLKALSALLEALPEPDGERFTEQLDTLRAETRVELRIDPRPMRLQATCPECYGVEVPRVARFTLLANAEAGRVWCSNPRCGVLCENPRCWCAAAGATRKHRMVWNQKDLIRLGQLVDLTEIAS